MKEKISSNYLLNKYSYLIYGILTFCFYKLIVKQYDIRAFIFLEIPLTMAYIVWIITNGSFHFLEETNVYIIDNHSLCLKKLTKTVVIRDTDVDAVYFYPVVFTRGRNLIIKIKLIIYTKEEFYFQIKTNKEDIDYSKIFDTNYFYRMTQNFYETINETKIKLADSIFSV